MNTGSSRRVKAASTVAALVLIAHAAPISAAPEGSGASDEQRQNLSPATVDARPLRNPPGAAVAACEAKKEGDACTFLSSNGTKMEGECLAGREMIFACRPYRRNAPPGAVNAAGAEPQAEQKNAAPGRDAAGPPSAGGDIRSRPSSEQMGDLPVVQPPAGAPLPPVPHAPAAHQTLPTALACLAAALSAALLTWYIFFRHITIPLRRLRIVTQQLACGNLAARVGEGLVHRRDEVADLARDVDRMAERIESLVGAHHRLIRDVSHELRSPLARLNVALELARQSSDPANSAPFDRIGRESERLNELVGQLLMLTRLESESGMGNRADFDLAELVRDIAHDVNFEAQANDRRVSCTSEESLVIPGNRELFRQALENVLRNAVRYTDAGTEVKVTVKKREAGGRRHARIEVLDHGPGVPESELVNIFRPFYRVGDSRERQSGGAGVGLAIADRAVRLHGGLLRAFNAPGAGLIMELDIPLPN